MLDVLQLDVPPPVPLTHFFEPDFLARLANPPKKEAPRLPPAAGKKERISNFEGLQASARQAALAELRQHAQPEPVIPEADDPKVTGKKVKVLRRSHHKAVARPVLSAPSRHSRKITVEPRPEPASLKPRKANALDSTEVALRRLNEMYEGLRKEILSAKAQVNIASCNTLPAAETRADEVLKRVRRLQTLAAKKHR
ncbi:MAG: hypothetical protein EON60_14080 [Alphaproteobacteria bacterium]|nr:MAG: hypothetical protein EON60_14080 [Alphaproteobacteria bacterium]